MASIFDDIFDSESGASSFHLWSKHKETALIGSNDIRWDGFLLKTASPSDKSEMVLRRVQVTSKQVFCFSHSKKDRVMAEMDLKLVHCQVNEVANGEKPLFEIKLHRNQKFTTFFTDDESLMKSFKAATKRLLIQRDIEMDFEIQKEIGKGGFGKVTRFQGVCFISSSRFMRQSTKKRRNTWRSKYFPKKAFSLRKKEE